MVLTADQNEMVEAFRRLLTARHTLADVRRLEHPEGPAHSDRLWAELRGGGWVGVAFDPKLGGGGASLTDLGLLFREAGRVLVPTSWRSTLHAAWLMAELGGERSMLEQLVSGERLGAVGFAEDGAERDARYLRTRATPHGDEWRLHGGKLFVPDAAVADVLVVAARVAPYDALGPVRFFSVDPATAGVTLTPHRTFGHDAQYAAHFDDATAREIGSVEGEAAMRAWQRATDRAMAVHLMYMVGCVEAVMDMTAEHVKTRHVFGRPIGTFQKPQHLLADMEIALRGGRLAALRALAAVEADHDAARALAVAKVWLGKTFKEATVWAHQLFGGMGYVKEGDLYLYSRAAVAADAAFGWGPDHLEEIADRLEYAGGRTR